ncbi:PPE domain-containing protein [Nocardia sp. NPDC051052]|uniref:PPE domain-containing protein n=1 Tax=Nocardia sp. NPDC051052 TaxID=3364322 RepID=UPI0037BB6E77
MAEPAQHGFTGTVWDAVPAEQLAHELTTGPGVVPMAEAGFAYTALSARLSDAALEYHGILSVVGNAWGSHSSQDALAQLAQLGGWLDASAAAARSNAAAGAQQAAAYEIAQLAMPHVAEVSQALHTAEDLIKGSLLGGPLAGVLDTAEQQLDALREQAAQVMRTYEAASEQLATPWQPDPAPAVSDGAALLAEEGPPTAGAPAQGPAASASSVPQPALQMPQGVDLSALDLAPVPTVPVGSEPMLLPPVLSPGVTMAPAPATVQLAAQPMTAAPPIMPPVADSRAQAKAPVSRAVAAEADDLGDSILVQAGFATAPAVLGRTDHAVHRSVPAGPAAED